MGRGRGAGVASNDRISSGFNSELGKFENFEFSISIYEVLKHFWFWQFKEEKQDRTVECLYVRPVFSKRTSNQVRFKFCELIPIPFSLQIHQILSFEMQMLNA